MNKWITALIGVSLLATVGCQEVGQRALGQSSYTEQNILRIAQTQVARKAFPEGTSWLSCYRAEYRSGPRIWVVTCGYSVEKGETESNPKYTRAYQVSDIDGRFIE